MIKLARHDKNFPNDSKMLANYKADYVYKQVFFARICALIGCMAIIAVIIASQIIISNDLVKIDWIGIGVKFAVFAAAVLTVSSIAGRSAAKKEYEAAEKRMEDYLQTIKVLELIHRREEQAGEEQ